MSHPFTRFVREIKRLPLFVALLMMPVSVLAESALDSLLIGGAYINQSKPYAGFSASEEDLWAPLIRYDHENFFVDGLYGNEAIGGWRFWRERDVTVSAVGRLNTAGYDSGDSINLIFMEDREWAFEVGVEAEWKPTQFGLRGQVLADVTGEHEGQEARAEITWEGASSGWTAEYAAGVMWQSEDMVEYYFGVAPNEAIPMFRPAYLPDAEISARGAGTLTYDLLWPITIVLHAEYRWFGDEIDDSPIVSNRGQWTLGGGIAYRFGETSRPRERGYRRQ